MKKTIKFLLIAFLAFCLTGAAIGEWNATIHIDVTKGDDDCSPNGYVGDVECFISGGDSDTETWKGYYTYTFNLDAPDVGDLSGVVNLTDGDDPPQFFCYGSDGFTWTSPPNPTVVNLEITPVI